MGLEVPEEEEPSPKKNRRQIELDEALNYSRNLANTQSQIISPKVDNL